MPGPVGRLRRFGTVGAVLAASLLLVIPGGGAASEPPVTVRVAVAGEGRVYSLSRLVSCTSRCSYQFRRDKVLTLGVKAGRDFRFEGWRGSCLGDGPRCIVAADAGGTVRARFRRLTTRAELVVSGSGTVVGSPSSLACGVQQVRCAADVGKGAPLVLRARPLAGHQFVGWSRACRGDDRPACTITPVEDVSVGATFRSLEPQPGRLTVLAQAPGFVGLRPGLVNTVPAGIDCPPTCEALFPAGTRVTLRTPFLEARWGGACVGEAKECPLIVDSELVVTAGVSVYLPFTPPAPARPSFGLNVTVSGRGTVTDGRRIRCGVAARTIADCRALFQYGEVVVLRAVARPDAQFGGWGGFCRGAANTCRVRATAAKTVTGFFRRR